MARARTALMAAIVVVGAALSAPEGQAAAAADPATEAQSMFAARQSATAVSNVLRRDHSRNLTQSATILRNVGFDAKAAVPALRTEYGASLSAVYGSLKDAGFSTRNIADAFASNNIKLDCIDPQGYPIPCGQFGGTADQAVMGQLTWSPASEGTTGSTLTINGTNIPAVTVRLGFATLTQVSASATSVKVRLPASPQTGDLRIIRKSDNVSGLLQAGYRVVSPPVAWASFAAPAADAAVAEMRRWLSGAQVTAGCVVNGALAAAGPGVLTSTTDFALEVRTKLTDAGATLAVATAWDTAFRAAFTDYTSNVTIPALPLYPTLLSVAAPQAAPAVNAPTPLGLFVSSGLVGMQALSLGSRLTLALEQVSTDSTARQQAISTFSGVVAAKFAELQTKALVVRLMGSGPVPTYGPASPVGAVQGGSCSGTNIVLLP